MLIAFVLIFLSSLPLIAAYFHPGLPFTHDGASTVIRLSEMFRELKDFQIPPRWSGYLNHGYGYPLFNFTYPLPYFLGMIVYLFRLGLVNSIKIIFASSVPLSGIAMFLLAKKLWKNSGAALICALLYMYLPYRLVNLYVRGSIGESVGLIFYPLVLYFASSLPLTALAFALLITSHNIAAVYFLPIAGVFFLAKILEKQIKETINFILALLLGAGLSAFFWLPAILEQKYISLSQAPIANRQLYFLKSFSDLLIPKWGDGVPGTSDGFGYQLGWPHLIIFILAAVLIFRRRLVFPKLLVILFLGLLPFLFSFTNSIWNILPLYKTINYPWTLLLPLGFTASLLAGALWQQIPGKILAIVLSTAAILLVINHTTSRTSLIYPDNYYLTNDGTTTSSQELIPLWVKKLPASRPDQKIEILQGRGRMQIQTEKSQILTAQLELATKSLMQIKTIYYPGWKVYLDGKETKINYDNQFGIMEILAPAGRHFLEARFTETPLRLAADVISLISAFLVLAMLLSKVRKQRVPAGKTN